MRSRSCLISLLVLLPFAAAYPVIVQVDESSERCLRFNIPEDDDAHLVALVLPNEDELGSDDAMETWFVDQVHAQVSAMTKAADNKMLSDKLPGGDAPDAVASKMRAYLQEKGSMAPLRIRITGTPVSDPTNYQHQYQTHYFKPTVVNYLSRTTDAWARRHRNAGGEGANLEGYGICLTNSDPSKQVQVIFDIVLLSEESLDEDISDTANRFTKDKHLSPLEMSLDRSINDANSVLREMNYMEKREARMRKTAESINTRVRWFSYLSISILLAVTYIQVTYLKRYFHKKKLM